MNLEELILSGNISKALELVHNDQLPPVFVPSYKNRKGTFIDKMDQIPSEVHLFIYDDDRDNYPESFPENVNVHIIHKTENWKGIPSKRKYMLDYAIKTNIQKYIQLDDDYLFYCKYPVKTENGNILETCSLWDMLRLLNRLTEGFSNVAIAGFRNGAKKYKWKNIFKPRLVQCACCVLTFTDVIKNAGVNYCDDTYGGEDTQFSLDCYLAGLKVLNTDFGPDCYPGIPEGGKNSVASGVEKQNGFGMYFYERYKGFAKFVTDFKHNRFWGAINWNNIKKNDNSYNEELYNACVERNAEKVLKILKKN